MTKSLVLAAAFAVLGAAAAAQPCSEIRFQRGAHSGEVAGRVTDLEPLCFTFAAAAGQTARVELLGSENTCFTIPGVTECQADVSFRTAARGYEVQVYQLFRRLAWEAFRLRLTIR